MNKEQFRAKKWGVFCHYLDSLQNGSRPNNTRGETTPWDQCVEELDCDKLASQLSDLGAGYLGITMQQGTRHFIAPNRAFEELTGVRDGCAKRDLVHDLSSALSKKGIALFLYYTGDGMPREPDDALRARFGWTGENIPRSLVEEWSRPLREYSLRYGDKVSGWWIDGAYQAIGYDLDKLGLLHSAARAGNPDSLIAFNHYGCFTPGVAKTVSIEGEDVLMADFYQTVAPPTPLCDYTAGELVCFNAYPDPTRTWDAVPHLFSFLGIPSRPWKVYDGWGRGGSKYSPEYMADYIHAVNRLGGVVTVDMRLYRNGSLEDGQRKAMSLAAKD